VGRAAFDRKVGFFICRVQCFQAGHFAGPHLGDISLVRILSTCLDRIVALPPLLCKVVEKKTAGHHLGHARACLLTKIYA